MGKEEYTLNISIITSAITAFAGSEDLYPGLHRSFQQNSIVQAICKSVRQTEIKALGEVCLELSTLDDRIAPLLDQNC